MRFFLSIFLVIFGASLFANEKQVIFYDTNSTVTVRKVSFEKEKQIFSDKDFIYDTNVKLSKNWFELFWEWLMKLIGKPFEEKPKESYNAMKYFFAALFIAGVIFVLYKTTFSRVLSKNSKTIKASAFSDLPDDIESVSINTLIEKAIQDKNYRLAVRWCFLQVLQSLNRQNKILWQPSKTNMDYQKELNQSDLKDRYMKLSRLFEYVWYGEQEIDEVKCLEYKNQVEQFIKHVEGQ